MLKFFILSDGEENKTIDNESPIMIKTNIQDFKVGATMY